MAEEVPIIGQQETGVAEIQCPQCGMPFKSKVPLIETFERRVFGVVHVLKPPPSSCPFCKTDSVWTVVPESIRFALTPVPKAGGIVTPAQAAGKPS